MSTTAAVPGYTVTGVAGISSGGAVRQGLDGSGRPVAIRALTDAPAGLQARARTAATVRHPGVAAVRELVQTPDGPVLVQDFVDGPTLSTLRAARRGLSAAECTQLVLELLAALEVLHAAGIIHGDVSPANVIVAPAEEGHGRAVLVDLVGDAGPERGTRGFRAPEVEAGVALGTAADVYAAAQLSLWAAEPGAREEVRALLAPLLAADPEERPSARRGQHLLDGGARVAIDLAPAEVLASATLREHAARELTTRARRGRARPRRRHRARRRQWAVRCAAVAVLIVAVVAASLWTDLPARLLGSPGKAGLMSASAVIVAQAAQERAVAQLSAQVAAQRVAQEHAARAHQPDDTSTGPEAEVAAAVRDLLAGRDEALTARDAVALAAVTVPGSPLAGADAASLRELTDADLHLRGYRTEVVDLTVLSVDPESAVVRAELYQGAHERVTPDGTAVAVPEQSVQCVQLQLRRQSETDTWRAGTATTC